MDKHLFLILCFLLSPLALAQEEHRIAVRIQRQNDQVTLLRLEKKDVLPAVMKNKEIESLIAKLQPGEEAIVVGHITLEPKMSDDHISYRPFFVVEELRPLSFQKLNELEFDIPERSLATTEKHFSPIGIPVSAEVASSITLTAAMLLMQGLTASPYEPKGKRDLNKNLVLYSGFLATGSFIYDQIFDPKKAH